MRLGQDGSPSGGFLEGVPLDLSEEDTGYMMSALEHHHWARGFLRRIDPEARKRFSDSGWAYGDPTYMGGSPDQLYDAQLDSVLAAVFPRLTGEVLTATEGELGPGLILDPETGEPVDAGDALLLHSVDWIVLAMFRGRTRDDVAHLKRGLRLAVPDRRIFRRTVEEPADEHNAILVFDAQWGPEETIYYELFEGLIKAYEALREEDERSRAERNRNGGRKAHKAPGEGPRGQARGRGRGTSGRRRAAPSRRRGRTRRATRSSSPSLGAGPCP